MLAGIGSYTYPWAIGVSGYPPPSAPLDATGLAERAAELGASVIQIADNLPLDRLPEAELSRFRETARRRNLVVEVGTRGVEPARLLRYLEIARYLDSRIVRTLTHNAESQPDLAQAEAWIREVLPAYERASVSLALENYERHTASELASLIDRIGSTRVGVCLDTVNSLGALETPSEIVARLAPHVLNVHVKDFEIRRIDTMMGFLVTGQAAGRGRLDIAWIVDQLARYGRDVNLIVELWTPYSGDVGRTVALEREWAAESVRYLKQYERRPARPLPEKV